jgi:hypothetical protein
MDIMGTADPFVMCTVGKKSVKTKVSKATLTPKWDQTFEFGDEYITNRYKKRGSPKNAKVGLTNIENILLVVKDWNRTGPAQFIGQVNVDLLMMEGQPVGIPVRMSYPLEKLQGNPSHSMFKNFGKKTSSPDSIGDVHRGMIDISVTITSSIKDGGGGAHDDEGYSTSDSSVSGEDSE